MLATMLRQLRTAHDYTLAQVARESGLSVPYLSDLEHGRSEPSLQSLIRIAAVYDMGAGDLLVEAGYSTRFNHPKQRRQWAADMARRALEDALAALWEAAG